MNRFITTLAIVVSVALSSAAIAQSAFTYQGKLTDAGIPADGLFSASFTLWDAAAGGTQIGPLNVFEALSVEDGLFTVNLNFGAGAFNGQDRFLQIWIGGELLTPRQQIRPAPYAMYALNGGTGGWTNKGVDIHTQANVGIGTTNPLAQVHIDGSATSGLALFLESPGSTTGNMAFGSPAGSVGMSANANNGNRRDIRFTDTGIGLWTRNSGSMPIAGNGLFIHESGNVGVGTADPQHLLHVNGIMRVGGTTPGLSGANGDYLYIQPNSTGLATFLFHQEKLRFSNAYGEIMRLHRGGDVGIGYGTSTPAARLGVKRDTSGTVLRVAGSGSGGTGIVVSDSNIGILLSTPGNTGTALQASSVNGTARAASFYGNSSSPMVSVWNDGTGGSLLLRGTSDVNTVSGGLLVLGDVNALNIGVDNNEIMARNNGVATTLHLNHNGGDVHIGQGGGSSTLSTPVLQITGGADLSEMFDVGGDKDIEPGTVVSIDPEHAGRLMPSTTAYDLKVAGIISGAGGVATGMRMGHDGTIADGEHPVALSGRVYCFVDATDHGIQPGDMLTTSDTPGHAMKVIDRDRAQGAIIGKAMTSLAQGETGLVLVLVTLQ